jgi:hypothetical protein
METRLLQLSGKLGHVAHPEFDFRLHSYHDFRV